jgi:MoxR-like ATPases
MARVLGAKFQRVQFTPDTTASELIGTVVMRGGEPFLERGAIFTNVLLADEINRTPPKTQSALLEAMQERHVSLMGRTFWIEPPFFVMATQNPHEHEGVYPITESQLDRFIFKIDLDYGSEDTRCGYSPCPIAASSRTCWATYRRCSGSAACWSPRKRSTR